MSFLTPFLSTCHLEGRKRQFAQAATEHGLYPRQNQVAEVAIVGDWEEFAQVPSAHLLRAPSSLFAPT